MLPVWLLSPKVIEPLEAVKMRANSADVRLMPATAALLVPPMLMGRDGSEERMVTEEAMGWLKVNSFIVPEPSPTNRLPCASKTRACGSFTPVNVALGAVRPA